MATLSGGSLVFSWRRWLAQLGIAASALRRRRRIGALDNHQTSGGARRRHHRLASARSAAARSFNGVSGGGAAASLGMRGARRSSLETLGIGASSGAQPRHQRIAASRGTRASLMSSASSYLSLVAQRNGGSSSA